jgi:hypothetical protein
MIFEGFKPAIDQPMNGGLDCRVALETNQGLAIST